FRTRERLLDRRDGRELCDRDTGAGAHLPRCFPRDALGFPRGAGPRRRALLHRRAVCMALLAYRLAAPRLAPRPRQKLSVALSYRGGDASGVGAKPAVPRAQSPAPLCGAQRSSRLRVVAVLAIGAIGAIFIPVFSGYGAEAIAGRLRDADAKVLICADGFYRRGQVVAMKETADAAADAAPSVKVVVVVRRLHREVTWK